MTQYEQYEINVATQILILLKDKQYDAAVDQLIVVKDQIYADIPDKKRISRGITWVVERIGRLL